MHVIYDELYSLTRWKAKLHLKRICGAQGHLIRSALYDILRIFHENPWKKCPWKKPDVFGLLVQDKFEKKGWKNWKKAHGNIAKNSMDLSMVLLYIFPWTGPPVHRITLTGLWTPVHGITWTGLWTSCPWNYVAFPWKAWKSVHDKYCFFMKPA